MQKFLNNWRADVELAEGSTALAVALPNGTYLLTIADSATSAARWEIVRAVVVGGVATLTRAQESTTDQDWPAGSVMYIDATAGFLNAMVAQLAALTARVVALEEGAPPGALTDSSGALLRSSTGEILTTGATV